MGRYRINRTWMALFYCPNPVVALYRWISATLQSSGRETRRHLDEANGPSATTRRLPTTWLLSLLVSLRDPDCFGVHEFADAGGAELAAEPERLTPPNGNRGSEATMELMNTMPL